MRRSFPRLAAIVPAVAAALLCGAAGSARADMFKHSTAVFAGLDKITGRIISFEVGIGETVQFGTLQITPRVCYSRPPTEAPRTDGFVEVYEVDVNKTYKKIFSGWMFADSPGLHGVEHPVYDVWLTDCGGKTQLISSPPDVAEQSDQTGAAAQSQAPAATPQRPPQAGPNNGAAAGNTAAPPLRSTTAPPLGNTSVLPSGNGSVPPLGPPVYVPSAPDPVSPTSPAPGRNPTRPQPSQRYYPAPPDPDNPYH